MRREKIVHEEDSYVQHEVVTKDVECQFNYLVPSLGMSLVYCKAGATGTANTAIAVLLLGHPPFLINYYYYYNYDCY